MKIDKKHFLISIFKALAGLAIVTAAIWFFTTSNEQQGIKIQAKPNTKDVGISDVEQFKKDSIIHNKMSEYGEKIVKNTYDYFYKDNKKIGNHLACENCHINAGTKAFAAPFIGLTKVYPLFSARLNKMESLEDRINDCFERSMNAEAINVNSLEMKAIVSYITKLSETVKEEGRINGQGLVDIAIPNRKANLTHGKKIFSTQCMVCHGRNGQGTKDSNNHYIYPPLWGNDSYNNGAGMTQVLTAARFIKGNMPFGATYDNPILTDEQAYDVAAYINSFERPVKKLNTTNNKK